MKFTVKGRTENDPLVTVFVKAKDSNDAREKAMKDYKFIEILSVKEKTKFTASCVPFDVQADRMMTQKASSDARDNRVKVYGNDERMPRRFQ